jgi:hypothetical protein
MALRVGMRSDGRKQNITRINSSTSPHILLCWLASVQKDQTAVVTLLLKLGADPNAKQVGGAYGNETPLKIASEYANKRANMMEAIRAAGGHM